MATIEDMDSDLNAQSSFQQPSLGNRPGMSLEIGVNLKQDAKQFAQASAAGIVPVSTQRAPNTSPQHRDVQLFQELKRFIFQFENILEFSKDEASDVQTLVKLLEQCVGKKIKIEPSMISVLQIHKMLSDVHKRLGSLGILKTLDTQESSDQYVQQAL